MPLLVWVLYTFKHIYATILFLSKFFMKKLFEVEMIKHKISCTFQMHGIITLSQLLRKSQFKTNQMLF